ncbi:MAG: hypothetical protein K0B07_00080 [DPANN group archaeon]|nr:hypothetical protein [DPANN group archaeon]
MSGLKASVYGFVRGPSGMVDSITDEDINKYLECGTDFYLKVRCYLDRCLGIPLVTIYDSPKIYEAIKDC